MNDWGEAATEARAVRRSWHLAMIVAVLMPVVVVVIRVAEGSSNLQRAGGGVNRNPSRRQDLIGRPIGRRGGSRAGR